MTSARVRDGSRTQQRGMVAIATLDTGQSAGFNQRDPAMVKWLGQAVRPS